ncbi:T9SS type A sorting domain-containing protein, partial [Lacinutrix sp. MedPE-SW]|uniref:T9SS type A sorting domain-containing protein n=1 Tax=Lacinutrix sp. MedPE-SW TaxID=1860087 RepID=UPI0009242FD0
DVWYSFTAAVDGTYTVTIDETFDSGFTSTYVSAYEGSCGALTQIGSSTSCFNTSNLIVTTVSGQTYYVNVRSSSATNYTEFDLCIYVNPPAPANDDCENATPISASTDSSCNNVISGTTQSATDSTDGCGTSGRDVWYSFTAPADGDFVITETETFDSGSTTTYVTAYEGACGALTQVGSSTSCTNSNALTLTAVSGTTYYVNIRSSSATNYTEFDLCIFQLVVPENDACENATTINAGDSISGSTVGATNVENLTVCSGGTVGTTCDPGGDSSPNGGTLVFGTGVWYVYNSPGNESISIEDSAGAFDSEIQVWSGACGSLVCVAGDDDSSNVGSGGFVCFDSEAAPTTYYIYIDGNASTGVGNYTLNLNTTPLPPANNLCSGAEALTLGVQATGDTTNATDSGVAAASCGAAGADQDIWYSFVATATGQVDIDTDADTAAVYDACGGTEIACVGTGVTNVDGLVDGTTYYVRLYNTGTAKVAGPVVLTVTESSLSTTDFDNNIVFSYYPNPVKNTLTLSAQEEISNVTIVNMLGQTVLKAAPNAVSKELDMSSLSSGAYFVQVTVGNAVDTVKIIKN